MAEITRHPCAATRCTAMVASHLLMCRADWARVPRDIQTRVYRTYKARARDGWAAYQTAVHAAVDAVDTAGRQTK